MFSATVVKDFKTFYSGIKSSDVTVTVMNKLPKSNNAIVVNLHNSNFYP